MASICTQPPREWPDPIGDSRRRRLVELEIVHALTANGFSRDDAHGLVDLITTGGLPRVSIDYRDDHDDTELRWMRGSVGHPVQAHEPE